MTKQSETAGSEHTSLRLARAGVLETGASRTRTFTNFRLIIKRLAKSAPKYEKRIVAYIDILGFKDIIDKTVFPSGKDDSKNIKYLLLLYKRFKRVLKPHFPKKFLDYGYKNPLATPSKKVTTFSDSIVISFQYSSDRNLIHNVFNELRELVTELIWHGIICRGGISYGKLLHTNVVVFGPALVNAYDLETRKAKYPRIIIEEKVMELLSKSVSTYSYESTNFIKKDFDGEYFVDYLSIHSPNGPPMLQDTDWLYLKYLRRLITQGLKLSFHPDYTMIREKYIWMRNHFNLNCDYYSSKEFYTEYYLENGGFSRSNPEYKPPKKIEENLEWTCIRIE